MARRVWTIGLAMLLLCPTLPSFAGEPPKPKMDPKLKRGLVALGVDHAEFFWTFISEREVQVRPDATDLNRLSGLVHNHNVKYKQSLAGPKLIDGIADFVLVAATVETAGTAVVVTAPLRAVKSYAMDKLTESIENDLGRYLSKNLQTFEQQAGIDFESLKGKTPDEIIEKLDSVELYRSMKEKINDETGKKVLDKASAGLVLRFEREQWKTLAKHEASIGDLQARVQRQADRFGQFMTESNERMAKLELKVTDLGASVGRMEESLGRLEATTAANTTQLKAVVGILYGRGTPAEQLSLLKSGYRPPDVTEEQLADLTKVLETKAKVQEVAGTASEILQAGAAIGQVARKLGIGGPGLDKAIKVAVGLGQAASQVATGNYVGAVFSLVGTFMKPAPSETQILQAYVADQFEQVNVKLNQIFLAQQEIYKRLVQLEEKVENLRREMHERFDRVDRQLLVITQLVDQVLKKPLGDCGTFRNDFDTYLKVDDGINSPRSFHDYGRLHHVTDADAARASECVKFVRVQFACGLGECLEFRPLDTIAPTDGTTLAELESERAHFKNLVELLHWRQATYGLDDVTLLFSLSLPSETVGGLARKLEGVKAVSKDYCAPASELPDTLKTCVCGSTGASSHNASVRAKKVLDTPLRANLVSHLGELALEMATIANLGTKTVNGSAQIRSFDEFLATLRDDNPNFQPEGNRILMDAAPVFMVTIAQINLLTGDVSARVLFDLLWDGDKKRWKTVEELDTEQEKRALAVFQADRGNLGMNVVLLGLDASRTVEQPSGRSPSGEEMAYETALDMFQDDALDESTTGLLRLFGADRGWKFDLVWRPKDETARREDCQSGDSATKRASCYPVPVVQLYERTIALPEPRRFAERQFVYSTQMTQLIEQRDTIRQRITNAGFFRSMDSDQIERTFGLMLQPN